MLSIGNTLTHLQLKKRPDTALNLQKISPTHLILAAHNQTQHLDYRTFSQQPQSHTCLMN